MTPEEIVPLFSAGGSYRFRRWEVPVAPLISGTDDAGIRLVDETLRWLAGQANHEVRDLDPDFGTNFAVLFVREWAEIGADPGIAKLLPDWQALVPRLAGQNRYLAFRMGPGGGIRAAVTLLRYDDALQAVTAQDLALEIATRGLLMWDERALAGARPMIRQAGRVHPRPEILALMRAAYDPVLPVAADDASHAYRLSARIGAT